MLIQLYLSTFLRSWAESFKALLPEQLQLFLLVTLNAMRLFYRVLWASIGYELDILFLGIIALVVFQNYTLVWVLFFAYIQSFFVEITRPSVAEKIPPIAAILHPSRLTTLIFMIGSLILYLPSWPLYFLTIPTAALYKSLWISIFSFPFTLFWALFFSDSRYRFVDIILSAYRALLMLIFNFPRCLIFFLVLVGITTSWWLLCELLPGNWSYIAFSCGYLLVIVPFNDCLFTNMYIQRIHEQFPLYYPEADRA